MENGKGDLFNVAVLGGSQGIQRYHPVRVVGPDLKVQFHNTTQFLVPNKRGSDFFQETRPSSGGGFCHFFSHQEIGSGVL